ncbi:hypothetical protein BD410DRAFT_832160 [Rickenella mellea]|uniref:Uncharacterized protein n=1 Tax=Rickenella mellea TaxID=50990 RepID=A0A4Y7PLE2_9AGAM|nr:hypothetical protein BD410DRAFT_832160 [Rickenella mellea]
MDHPIHHLLPEIISEIFIHCLTRNCPGQKQAPLNVSSVCRQWRQIATSTPHLWSQISIHQSWNSRTQFVRILKLWISRSGSCGFSFAINWMRRDFSGVPDTAFQAILGVLLDNCEAWRNVQLTTELSLLTEFLSVIPGRTPKIQKITIHGVGGYETFSLTKLFAAPLVGLTHLFIDASTRFLPCSNGLLLENLRSLHLRYVDQLELIDCLSRSPRLQEFKAWFTFNTPNLQPIHNHVNVCLPHLRSLQLILDVFTWEQGKRGPFDHFQFPALETLFLDILSANLQDPNVTDHLSDLTIEFACRYANSLQHLEIDGRFINPPAPFVDRLPKLKHLGVPISFLDNEDIQGLVLRFSSSAHQPRQVFSHIESLSVFAVKGHSETNLSAIIRHAVEEESSTAVCPVTILVPSASLESFIVPQGSMVHVRARHEWRELHRHDLYREIGWVYSEG